MSKIEEFYNTLVKDPDLEIKDGQTREQAARTEAEYRSRQYNNNVQALALATQTAEAESPINSLFNHLEQMKKSMPETVLIKARADFETPPDEDSPNTAQQTINNKAEQLHTDIKNEERHRNLNGQNYKRLLQEHESDKIADADKANRTFQILHEDAKKKYNDRQQRFRNQYTIRESKAKDLENEVTIGEKTKTERKQAIEDYKNSLNNSNKSMSTEIKQDRKSENDNRIRRSEGYKEEFKNVEQSNLERAKRLQDGFAGETQADRIDEYRKALRGGLTDLHGQWGAKENISFDVAQRRMYPKEGQAHPTQAEQYDIIRQSRGIRGQDLSNAEVKSLLNGTPLTDKEHHQQLINSFRFQNIHSVEDAKAAISPKLLTDENIFQNLIDSNRFPTINSVEDAKAAMNPKPFTKKEKQDIFREKLSSDRGLFDRLRGKKVTDADITAALNPKQLTREEKIDYLMTGKDTGGAKKRSREEALEALKPPKQLTNKEKLQSLVGRRLYPDVKTEADAKNLLNPKPLTEQQQHEFIADRFSLSGPEEAVKAINATPFTDEEKIQFVQNDAKNRSFGMDKISAEEADTILNPKNKHFERPTFVDDPPAETDELWGVRTAPTAEEPVAEEPAPETEAPAEEPAAEVDTPTEQPTAEEPETTPEADPTGIGAINQDAAKVLQEQNDTIANNNKKIESTQNKISEIDSKIEELESKQDSKEGLSEQEFQDLQSLPTDKNKLETQTRDFEEKNTSAKGMQDAVLEGMKQNHQLTDDDISKLRESTDINALIDEGTQPETTQEQPSGEPEPTPEQPTRQAPHSSVKEHLGDQYQEKLDNGELHDEDGKPKSVGQIREEFPKSDAEEAPAEEPTTEEPEEEPTAEEPKTEEPEPTTETPSFDKEINNLINTADENGTLQHMYEKEYGKDNDFVSFEEFKADKTEEFQKGGVKKTRQLLGKAHSIRNSQQITAKDKQNTEDANTVPYDKTHFKDVTKEDATHMATELLAHSKKHADNMSPATKKKLADTLATAKEAGADFERIAKDEKKLGDKFGDEEHSAKLQANSLAAKHATGDDDESKRVRRRTGIETTKAAKEFHSGEDLDTKTTTSHPKEGKGEHFDHPNNKKSKGKLPRGSMPPRLADNEEEMEKKNPNKQLIAENKQWVQNKIKDGYEWHPATRHWVHKEALSSLSGSHSGNAGTILGGNHQVGKHPPTILDEHGNKSTSKVLFSPEGIHAIGGDTPSGKALENSFKTHSNESFNALDEANSKNGSKLDNVSMHHEAAGHLTKDEFRPTKTTAVTEGYHMGQRAFDRTEAAVGSALSRFKNTLTGGGGDVSKSQSFYRYPTSLELLLKTYTHQDRLDARDLLAETAKKKKSIKKSSIIKV